MIGFFNSYKKEVFLNGNESVKAKAQSHIIAILILYYKGFRFDNIYIYNRGELNHIWLNVITSWT